MRSILQRALAIAITLLATPVHAGGGVNLSWDNCFGDAGTQNKSFACDTNTGSDVLVCSFELAQEVLQASGQEAVIDLIATASKLPAWWEFKNAGTCRQLSLTMNTVLSPTAVACTDWPSGQSIALILSYGMGYSGPTSATLKISTVVGNQALADLIPGTEYFVCNVVISHAKTVGTGACAGCSVPVCLLFYDQIMIPGPANDVLLEGPAHDNSSFATWQGPTGPAPYGCPYPLPTQRSTWGAVKSLYR
jgi:hypothetical protein